MDYIKAEDADIVCLQETKCDKSKIPTKAELPNYHCYWLSGDTQGKMAFLIWHFYISFLYVFRIT